MLKSFVAKAALPLLDAAWTATAQAFGKGQGKGGGRRGRRPRLRPP